MTMSAPDEKRPEAPEEVHCATESSASVSDIDPTYRAVRNAMRWSLAVSVAMLVGKVGAYLLTGSAAILSDAMESIIHIIATGLAAWSAWFASLPPSKKYPHGHFKISYFSAGFEGALIFVAALSIIYKAVEALIIGPKLHRLDLGLLLIAILGGINLFLGMHLLREGKKHQSLILQANGKHVLTDMWTSLAVLVGVAIVWGTGIAWLDPVVAILAALHIISSAFSLMRSAFFGLMEQIDTELSERIVGAFQEQVTQQIIVDFHELRVRDVQQHLWIEVHLLFAPGFSLYDAHTRACQVESHIMSLFPEHEVHITTHLEPSVHDIVHPEGHGELPDPLGQEE